MSKRAILAVIELLQWKFCICMFLCLAYFIAMIKPCPNNTDFFLFEPL